MNNHVSTTLSMYVFEFSIPRDGYALTAGRLFYLVTAENQCRTEINIRGMALKGFVLKRMTVAAPHICDIQCEREVTCQSVMHCSLFIMIRLH